MPSPASLIKRLGSVAMLTRRTVSSYDEWDEVNEYSEAVTGFQAMVDTSYSKGHSVEEHGIIGEVDLVLACFLDDTGSELDVRAVKDGIPDTVCFDGVYEVLRVTNIKHPWTKDEYKRLFLKRREHVGTTLTVITLDYAGDGWTYNEGQSVRLTITDENGNDVLDVTDGDSISTFAVEVLIDGTWHEASENGAYFYDESVDVFSFTVALKPGTWPARVRYDGTEDLEGQLYYSHIVIQKLGIYTFLTESDFAGMTAGDPNTFDIAIIQNDGISIDHDVTPTLEYSADQTTWTEISISPATFGADEFLRSFTMTVPNIAAGTYYFRVTIAANDYYTGATSATVEGDIT